MLDVGDKNYIIQQDLENVLIHCDSVWEELKGSNLFITGGTGFIGRWLLESLLYANDSLNLGITATILTRDPDAFKIKAPYLSEYKAFNFIRGDVMDRIDLIGDFTHLIHAATDASADLNEENPKRMFDTILVGTQNVLDFAAKKSIKRILFLSSGAVYGQQPFEMEHVKEDWNGSLNCLNPRNTYAEAKRAAEMLCAIYVKQFEMSISIARIFALLGPYLPIDTHFAAGNFIRDALNGTAITVKGNGLPCRSYLYSSDLTIWLWHMLVYAKSGVAYNVGSDESVSIRDLAERVSHVLGDGNYQVLGSDDMGWNLGRYVPDTTKITSELKVSRSVSLEDAIYRTGRWNERCGK